jgi:NTP pyrophosphatase (non-canonical NTP hydrolase)
MSYSFEAYQQGLLEFERARGWHRVLPSHTFVHITEELGEIGRVLQCLDGYRATDRSAEALRQELAGELADLTALVFKLASQHGIDLGEAMHEHLHELAARYDDVQAGRKEMARYTSYQERNLDWIRESGGQRL